MSERSGYPNGVPSWVDLASPDVDASIAFYSGPFGWEHAAMDPPEEAGGYGMFTLRGRLVAGIGPLRSETQPAVWNTSVAVDDADATVANVAKAGGQVAMPVLDVMDAGRVAFLIDPAGATFRIWQAGNHTGAQLVNEPGTLGWNELQCRDSAATAFYATVFGWEPAATELSGHEYTVFNLYGEAIGGLVEIDDRWPQEFPSTWMAYFAVAGADESSARAQELGGTVHVGPVDAGAAGRIAMIGDPNGTMFAIIEPVGEPD